MLDKDDTGSVEGMNRLMVELADVNRRLQRKIKELEAAREEIKTLTGLLPICMHCKSIRNDSGYWEQLEGYLSDRSELVFSHGICEDCMEKKYPSDDPDDD